MDLKLEVKQLPHGIEIIMNGELLFVDAQTFMQKIPQFVEGRGPLVILDMKSLKFIDSSGLGSLLYISEALRMNNQKLEIHHANDTIKKLLKVIQNVGTFTIVD